MWSEAKEQTVLICEEHELQQQEHTEALGVLSTYRRHQAVCKDLLWRTECLFTLQQVFRVPVLQVVCRSASCATTLPVTHSQNFPVCFHAVCLPREEQSSKASPQPAAPLLVGNSSPSFPFLPHFSANCTPCFLNPCYPYCPWRLVALHAAGVGTR